MTNFVSRIKVTPKFLLFVVLLGVLPLLVLGGTSIQTASAALEQESARYISELIANQSTYLRLQLSPVENLMSNLSGVDELRQVIDADSAGQDTYDRLATQARIGYILNNFSNIQGLLSVDIFTVGGQRFHYGDTLNTEDIDEVVRLVLDKAAAAADGQVVWPGISENVNVNSTTRRVLPAVRQLRRYDNTTLTFVPTALMVINYDPNYLYDYFNRIDFGEGAYMLVIDGSGRIIYHPNRELIGTELAASTRATIAGGAAQRNVALDGRDYLLTTQQANIRDWTISAFIPLDTLRAKTRAINNNALLALSFSLSLVLMAGIAINALWLRPIREIINRFERIQRAEAVPRTPLPIRTQDEVGELTQWFNLFVNKLDELEQASKLANESSRLKSEFLSTMSHEMRTPLNAIEGFTGIMLNGMGVSLEPRARGMLERVAANNQRLLGLVNDFLDLSRIEAGRWEMVERPMLPRRLSEQWAKETSSLIEKKGLRLETKIDPALPTTIYGDEDALSKVVLNLLSNAVKFTEEGTITLSMIHAGDSWAIQVSDTGIGIPPHAHEFIFDEFRQVDMSSTRKQGGTGLGLAIVKKMVRLMHGTITLRSEVGKGSNFTVTLPLVLEPQNALLVPIATT